MTITIPEEHMRQMDISFCGKVATNIVTSDAKQIIINNFNSLIKGSRYFNENGNRYKYANLINPKSITFLSKQPHLITLKTGGSNYFLFLTKINGVNNALFIDCKTKQGYTLPRIITADFKFSDDLFRGTVFDGEIVRDKADNWMFLISNIVALRGRVVTSNFVARMNLIYKVVAESYNPDPVIDICPVKVKKVYRYSDYDRLILMYIPKYEYEIKGMFFNSITNRHSNHLFMMSAPSKKEGYTDKRKTRSTGATSEINGTGGTEVTGGEVVAGGGSKSSDTLVFQIKTTDKPEIYELYAVGDTGVIEMTSVALIKKMAVSKQLKAYLSDTNKSSSCFCDCKYNTRFKKWEVVGINETAKIANSVSEIKNLEE
jgi:hypothetical protein